VISFVCFHWNKSGIFFSEGQCFNRGNLRLAPLKWLRYDNYLEANKSQQGPDQLFIKCFRKLITDGRLNYLVN
jgi:hypothetical protein